MITIYYLQIKDPEDDKISKSLANLSGYRCNLYPNQLALDIAVCDLVDEYRLPLKEAVEIIKLQLISAVEECCKRVFDTYPKLHEDVLYFINTNINISEEATKEHLMAHVDAQQAFMNLEHEEFKATIYKLELNYPVEKLEETQEYKELCRSFAKVAIPQMYEDEQKEVSVFSTGKLEILVRSFDLEYLGTYLFSLV